MKQIHASVPGSMMVFGEYFITAPNNSALCLAINKRATLDIRYTPIDATEIIQGQRVVELETRYEGKILRWDTPEDCDMYNIAQNIYSDFFPEVSVKASSETSSEKISVVIDTNAFFQPGMSIQAEGEPDRPNRAIANNVKQPAASNAKQPARKLGLGSSEASALLFCVLILILKQTILKDTDIQTHKNTLAKFATKVHYIWQGNRGSGYGIYTSLYGNMGVFHKIQKSHQENGQEHGQKTQQKRDTINVWTPLRPPVDIYWYYCILQHSVSTKQALSVFEAWKKNNNSLYQKIEEQARNAMKRISSITTEKAFIDWIQTVMVIGKTLGDYIGVSATLDEKNLPNDPDIVWKATGAGNENAIGVSHKATENNTGQSPPIQTNPTQDNRAIPIDIGVGLIIDIIEEGA